jgi:hypothetical protein
MTAGALEAIMTADREWGRGLIAAAEDLELVGYLPRRECPCLCRVSASFSVHACAIALKAVMAASCVTAVLMATADLQAVPETATADLQTAVGPYVNLTDADFTGAVSYSQTNKVVTTSYFYCYDVYRALT